MTNFGLSLQSKAFQELVHFHSRACDYAFTLIVTAGLILTCLVIAPLFVGARIWMTIIKRG